AEFESGDTKSLIFKNRSQNDFKHIYKLAEQAECLIEKVRSLLKDLESEIIIKIGILTEEEVERRHPFRWNLPYEAVKKIPDILIFDKTAETIIENYNTMATGLRNIWTTDGIEFSKSRKIMNIYFEREESGQLNDFIETEEKLLYIYGEKGSGKTKLVKKFADKIAAQKNIIYLYERKHSLKEFRIIHDLIYYMLFYTRGTEPLSEDDVLWKVENSTLSPVNKSNLIHFISVLYGENANKEDILFDLGKYKINIKKALNDALQITKKDFTAIIDNYQWISDECKYLFFDVLKENNHKNKLILISDDKNYSTDIHIPVRYLKISDLNKVQISKLLKLTFPRTRITSKTSDFIHKATGGNLYTTLEFLQYMLDKEFLQKKNSRLEVFMPDISMIPDNLSEMYNEKIRSLSENALNLIKIVSIMGDRFFLSDLDWLLHILNYPHDEAEGLKELESAGLINNYGDHYFVTEPPAVAPIYRDMNHHNKKLIHRLLAELFETKGYDDFGFKIFIHYYRSDNYDKLISILPDLRKSMLLNLNFNALKNIIDLSDKFLFKLCLKESVYPVKLWIDNLIFSKWIFDSRDPMNSILTLEKAIDYLIKTGLEESCPELTVLLLDLYISSGKKKKFDKYFQAGYEIAEKKGYTKIKYELLILRSSAKNYSSLTDLEKDLKKIDELRSVAGVDTQKHKYLMLKAEYLDQVKDTREASDIIKKILKEETDSLDFTGMIRTMKRLVKLYMKTRNYKAAEEYLKQLLVIEKDSSLSETIQINIDLAKIYGYQNKFLQAVSMIDSLISVADSPDLNFSLNYTLGSIYQFYDEKEMAVKTFESIIKKVRNRRSDKFYILRLKSSMMCCYFDEYEKALSFLKFVKKTRFRDLVKNIIQSFILFPEEKEINGIYAEFKNDKFTENSDLVFESAFLFLKFLKKRRKREMAKDMIKLMDRMQIGVEDFNIIQNYKKLSKNILRKPVRIQKKVSEAGKMSISAKKRVSRRRKS
ncbi:MAG: hypothetical protein R6V47_08085, partial [Candidatus Delongbacteria bacterium]